MTRLHVAGWGLFLSVSGASLLVYLLSSVSPYDDTHALLYPVVALFITAILVTITGAATLVALLLHQRYPTLAGSKRNKPPAPRVALRQGFLVGCMVIANLLLVLGNLFDIVFALTIPLLLGLIEVYWQRRLS